MTYLERLAAIERNLAQVTDTTFAASPFVDLDVKLCIAASARTGGNYLCEKLREHGIRCGEYFHSRRLRSGLAENGKRLEDYVTELVKRFSYKRTFAVKGAIDTLAVPYLSREYPEKLSSWRFVHLRRRGIIRQAISNTLALQTGQWRSVVSRDEVHAPDYDAAALLKSARQLIEVNALWEAFFDANGMSPLRVWYEDLDRSPDSVAAAVARFADVTAPPVPGKGPPRLSRQSGDMNAAWEARLRADEAPAVAALERRWRELGAW